MMQGVNIHRVHDVKQVNQAVKVFEKLNSVMKKKYFGTDGIRGRVKEFPIVEDFFFK